MTTNRILVGLFVLLLALCGTPAAAQSLSFTPSSVPSGGSTMSVTWSGIASPTATDWIGLFTPGAGNSAYIAWRYTTGAAAGTVPFSVPASVEGGTYQYRLFANNGSTLLATSANFQVEYAPKTIAGMVTNNGTALAGVSFSGSGASCTNSDAAGLYSCSVPHGWSGTLTPSLGSFAFSPASRSYSNVTSNQSAQNYALVFVSISGTVTNTGGAPFAGVSFTAGGGLCTQSNASGQYVCQVPSGWSGTVTPSRTGGSFTPMSRTYSAIITDQNAQDYMTQPTTPSASIFFIHPDHLNTPRLVANANQQAVWKWDQAEPFGVNAPNENPSSLGVFELPIRFPGQYADKETNTHYNYYRDYDPQTGRYSQSDPLGVRGGLATYVYVKNDSLSRIDPSGLQSVTGNWMIRPRFNIQDKGIDGWEFVSPSWSLWGYMKFVRLRGHASGYVNIDVKCVADCGNEWEIHNRISVEASGSIDVGPNLYGIIGGFAVGPYLGASINIVLAGASLLQAEYHFLSLVQQKAGGIIAGVLAHGPTAMCLGTQQ